MSDEQLLHEVKVRTELESMGYRRRECQWCGGLGNMVRADADGRLDGVPCLACDGKGYTWEGPLI